MIKHEFSYWLSLRGEPAQVSAAADEVKDKLDDVFVEDIDGDIPENKKTFEVDPDYGTTEEVADLPKRVAAIASKFPDLVVTLECIDEEDHICSHNHVWSAGKNDEAYGRYDIPEVEDMVVGLTDPQEFARRRAVQLLQELKREFGTDAAIDALKTVIG